MQCNAPTPAQNPSSTSASMLAIALGWGSIYLFPEFNSGSNGRIGVEFKNSRPGRRPTLQNKTISPALLPKPLPIFLSVKPHRQIEYQRCTGAPGPPVAPLGRMDYRTSLQSDRRPPAPAFYCASININILSNQYAYALQVWYCYHTMLGYHGGHE
jgi:hypothetical protein